MSLPGKEYEDDAPYTCTLSPEDQKKAQEELYENPKERMAAVQQLRDWIKRQPHISSRTGRPAIHAAVRITHNFDDEI